MNSSRIATRIKYFFAGAGVASALLLGAQAYWAWISAPPSARYSPAYTTEPPRGPSTPLGAQIPLGDCDWSKKDCPEFEHERKLPSYTTPSPGTLWLTAAPAAWLVARRRSKGGAQ